MSAFGVRSLPTTRCLVPLLCNTNACSSFRRSTSWQYWGYRNAAHSLLPCIRLDTSAVSPASLLLAALVASCGSTLVLVSVGLLAVFSLCSNTRGSWWFTPSGRIASLRSSRATVPLPLRPKLSGTNGGACSRDACQLCPHILHHSFCWMPMPGFRPETRLKCLPPLMQLPSQIWRGAWVCAEPEPSMVMAV